VAFGGNAYLIVPIHIMLKKVKRILIGKPLKSSELKDQKLGVLWGLPILSSDAISSVAYAGQEMLMVLIPVIGVAAYGQMSNISWAIVGLLALLVLSYRQTIDCYPNGGGAFTVAKDNIGDLAGMIASAALLVDYILTVAVSISSGVEQLTSAFGNLKAYSVIIAVALVVLLTIGNLRGIREASKIFGMPAYAFILGIIVMIIAGFYKLAAGYVPPEPTFVGIAQPLTLMLMLRAFSNGCTALTGIEAVSNAVPNFKSPTTKYAKKVLLILAIIIFVLFGGTAMLANHYHVVPGANGAMLILIAKEIFGTGFMFYYITFTTLIILVMAANTAYAGFPMLISVMAKEGYVPRQLNERGDRLGFDNGIVVLSVASILLIVVFSANVGNLIGLYAIGVFISFTLSQSGMFLRWRRNKGPKWMVKAAINGFGAVATSIVVVIIAITKFSQGAWIVVLLIPFIVFLLHNIKKHYVAVKMQLKIEPEEYAEINIEAKEYENKVIVPIESVNKASIRAIRYANTISNNVTVFTIAIDEESAREVREKYGKINTNIPLVVKLSPYRKVVEPLLRFIKSAEYDYEKGDMITVLLSQFTVNKWWQRFLHRNTWIYIEEQLLKHKHIVVAVMPLQLKDDSAVLKSEKKLKGKEWIR